MEKEITSQQVSVKHTIVCHEDLIDYPTHADAAVPLLNNTGKRFLLPACHATWRGEGESLGQMSCCGPPQPINFEVFLKFRSVSSGFRDGAGGAMRGEPEGSRRGIQRGGGREAHEGSRGVASGGSTRARAGGWEPLGYKIACLICASTMPDLRVAPF